MPGEDVAKIARGDDDLMDQSQPGVNQHSPACEVIIRLPAVIVQHDPRPARTGGQDCRHGAEQEGPVRGGEYVHGVGTAKAKKARDVEGLVHAGADYRGATEPSQSGGEARVDGDEGHLVAFPLQALHQGMRLDPVAPKDVQARRDQDDPHRGWPPLSVRS
jgi:hypothetical protein